jgi:hypothetical protein
VLAVLHSFLEDLWIIHFLPFSSFWGLHATFGYWLPFSVLKAKNNRSYNPTTPCLIFLSFLRAHDSTGPILTIQEKSLYFKKLDLIRSEMSLLPNILICLRVLRIKTGTSWKRGLNSVYTHTFKDLAHTLIFTSHIKETKSQSDMRDWGLPPLSWTCTEFHKSIWTSRFPEEVKSFQTTCEYLITCF